MMKEEKTWRRRRIRRTRRSRVRWENWRDKRTKKRIRTRIRRNKNEEREKDAEGDKEEEDIYENKEYEDKGKEEFISRPHLTEDGRQRQCAVGVQVRRLPRAGHSASRESSRTSGQVYRAAPLNWLARPAGNTS